MKTFLILFISLLFSGLVIAQDPAKDIKKAARLLGTYHLDITTGSDELNEAINLANTSINDPAVKTDPAAWLTYGEVFMAAVDRDVRANVAASIENKTAPITQPSSPAKAYMGFKMASELADKTYQTKDAMKALATGIQNIYYLGSALYQAGDFKSAFEAFNATYEAYNLLKKHNEPTEFSADEHPKSLYYSGVCAQQAGLEQDALRVYTQLVEKGTNEPSVYESLFKMYLKDNPAEAERILSLARDKFPDDTGILYAEINYYLAKGELEGLIDKLEKALVIEPDNVSVYVTLGQIYDKLYQENMTADPVKAEDSFTKAMSYYQQAMAKDPTNFDAVYSIGALWYNKAAAYSIELNELSNDYSAAGNKKYEAKQIQMNETFSKALPLFLQAEALNPVDYNTLIALKEIYARQDKLDLATEYKTKIEQLEKQ